MTLGAEAQEKEAIGPGFIHTVGIGIMNHFNPRIKDLNLDVTLEAGVGYRFDKHNTLGVAALVNCLSGWTTNVFFTHTYDFSDKPQSFFLGYEVGAADVFHETGWHLGIETGYRLLLGKKVPLRLGLSAERNQVFSIGLTARLEF